MTLEDDYTDILRKACRGLGWGSEELAARSGLNVGVIDALRRGDGTDDDSAALARVLGLHPEALADIRHGRWLPKLHILPQLLSYQDTSDPHQPNAYAVADAEGRAVIFDCAVDARPLIDGIRQRGWAVAAIAITHIHHDHIGGLPRLKHTFPHVPIYTGAQEPAPGATHLVKEGDVIQVGGLVLTVRVTSGHRAENIVYTVTSAGNPWQAGLAAVGDDIYAGSLGMPFHSYPDLLSSVRAQILSLPPDTVLLPGHGPLTTVEEELGHNPFFAK